MSDAIIQHPTSNIQNLQWDKMGGLIPAIIQQADSGAVLMLGYMNVQALALTQQTGRVHFWSRSRSELWLKGEKSGNYLLVVALQADCDGDALLVRVREATGSTAVCHTGAVTCFDIGERRLIALDRVGQQGGPPPAATEAVVQDEQRFSATVGQQGGPPPVVAVQGGPPPAPTNNPTPQSSVLTLTEVVTRLMGPGGCPWDMAQTHTSLKSNLLEETYEALDALDALGNVDDIPHERKIAKLIDELGDVLGQVVYQAQIGVANGEFTLSDIASAFSAKLVRRHPHVFAATPVSGMDEALKNWEEVKKAERLAEDGDKTTGAGLRSIPAAMPALHYAQQVQGRVKRSGYVWPERDLLLTRLSTSIATIAQRDGEADALIKVGDLLWQIVLLARSLGVNAEEALRLTVRRFVNDYRDLCNTNCCGSL